MSVNEPKILRMKELIDKLKVADQFLHAKDVGFIHTHSCVPPFL